MSQLEHGIPTEYQHSLDQRKKCIDMLSTMIHHNWIPAMLFCEPSLEMTISEVENFQDWPEPPLPQNKAMSVSFIVTDIGCKGMPIRIGHVEKEDDLIAFEDVFSRIADNNLNLATARMGSLFEGMQIHNLMYIRISHFNVPDETQRNAKTLVNTIVSTFDHIIQRAEVSVQFTTLAIHYSIPHLEPLAVFRIADLSGRKQHASLEGQLQVMDQFMKPDTTIPDHLKPLVLQQFDQMFAF